MSKIPHCCRSKASGPCLSPSVADHPLRSAKDLWLGRLLPYQLPNPPQAHLITELYLYGLFKIYLNYEAGSYVLLTRSPHGAYAPVRLACVKPLASVHSEPESNSSYLITIFMRIYILSTLRALKNFFFVVVL